MSIKTGELSLIFFLMQSASTLWLMRRMKLIKMDIENKEQTTENKMINNLNALRQRFNEQLGTSFGIVDDTIKSQIQEVEALKESGRQIDDKLRLLQIKYDLLETDVGSLIKIYSGVKNEALTEEEISELSRSLENLKQRHPFVKR